MPEKISNLKLTFAVKVLRSIVAKHSISVCRNPRCEHEYLDYTEEYEIEVCENSFTKLTENPKLGLTPVTLNFHLSAKNFSWFYVGLKQGILNFH